MTDFQIIVYELGCISVFINQIGSHVYYQYSNCFEKIHVIKPYVYIYIIQLEENSNLVKLFI